MLGCKDERTRKVRQETPRKDALMSRLSLWATAVKFCREYSEELCNVLLSCPNKGCGMWGLHPPTLTSHWLLLDCPAPVMLEGLREAESFSDRSLLGTQWLLGTQVV